MGRYKNPFEAILKLVIILDSGCHTLPYIPESNGYIRVRCEGRRWMAHVLFYVKFKGEVPNGKEVAHLCHNRRCINPEHLEAQTHKFNCKDRKTWLNPTLYANGQS